MTAYPWEPGLAPRSVSFARRNAGLSGPVSTTGRSQVIASDAGFWIATLSRINAAGPAMVKAYRRLFALSEGGVNQIYVPVFDLVNAPWPTPGTHFATSRFSDGTSFSDGTVFADPVIVVTLSSAASARATQLSVTKTMIGEVVGGEYFEIGNGHLHVIARVNDDGTWKIWPPLREDAASGAEINFDSPKCRMRLTSESADDLALELGSYGFPEVTFVEDLSS